MRIILFSFFISLTLSSSAVCLEDTDIDYLSVCKTMVEDGSTGGANSCVDRFDENAFYQAEALQVCNELARNGKSGHTLSCLDLIKNKSFNEMKISVCFKMASVHAGNTLGCIRNSEE